MTALTKLERRPWAAATVACALLSGACSAAQEPTKGESLGTNAEELLALSVFVNASVLGGTGVMLHVTGPSYDTTIAGSARLPGLMGDGTYTIATPAGEVPFGTFVVERGIVVHSTGAVAFGSGGLFFNTTKLATVSIPTSMLTIPAGVGRYRLGVASLAFQGSTLFRLPDGTFTVTAADGTRPLGTFTVAQRTVVAATGAISPRFNGVAFDTAALARVTVPIPSISTPAGLVTARLGDDTNPATTSSLTAFLADGAYQVTNNDKDRVFGSFTVAGRAVAGTSGGLTATATGVVFDDTKLARVGIDTTSLSVPGGLLGARVPKISNLPFTSASFLLPPGSYTVDDALSSTTAPRHYGDLTVTETSVSAANGALVATPEGVDFDLAALSTVTIPFSGLQSPTAPPVISGRLIGAGFGGTATPVIGATGTDPVFHLVDGKYSVLRNGVFYGSVWGNFDIANREVVAGTGAFKAGETSALELQTCNLSAVTLTPFPAPTGSTFTIPEIMPSTQMFAGGTLLLPPGYYTLRSSVPGQPLGRFVIPASGPLTSVIQPSWLATLSGTRLGQCLRPPLVTCRGNSFVPADIGFCSVVANDVTKLAGGCRDSGGGVASCSFDGMPSRELGAGVHTIVVSGAASDGSSATCTSVVRVHPCGDAPIVSCVGTAAKPVAIGTEPNTCGLGVSSLKKAAGACKPGADGLASCTFNGASATTLPAGVSAVTIVGTSLNGTTASCTSYVNVIDVQPPRITCPAPVTRECEGPLTPNSSTATCTDNCGLCAVECDPRPLPVGFNRPFCDSIDVSGRTAACYAQVRIVDTVAPSLEMAVSPSVLWPPTHLMRKIAITTSVADRCDPSPWVECSATSNEAPEGLGSGNTPADVEWIDGELFLRAERSGLGTGRVYTIECTSRDRWGNAQTKTATVTVPHEWGN